MIVEMKKIALLCMAERRHETVSALRDLGVVHLAGVEAGEAEELTRARQHLEHARRAVDALDSLTLTENESEKAHLAAQETTLTGEQIMERVLELAAKRQEIGAEIEALRHERERLAPFGDFDPQTVLDLRRSGLGVHLFRRPSVEWAPSLPAGGMLYETSDDGAYRYFVVVAPSGVFTEADRPDSWEEVHLPETSLGRVEEHLRARGEELDEVEADLKQWAGTHDRIEGVETEMRDRVRLFEVREGMAREGEVAFLRGFVPASEVEVLRGAAARNGWGLLIEEPAEGEEVPTLIRYPRWVRPIKAIFDLLEITPGYREADISVAFLLFFSLFFGMLIGDAGYGLLFMGITWLARRKMPKAPGYPFKLIYVLSGATVVWGLLTGNFFGITKWPEAMRVVQVDWLRDQKNVMGLCFLIGALHLTVAHVWNAIVRWPSLQALAQIGWTCTTWTMFYIAQAMVLGGAIAPWVYYLFGVGVVLIVLFMTPVKRLGQDWINHAILPLDIVGNFVDVVSYIRLFAVGMAGLAVAESFNGMALSAGFGTFFGSIGAALILLAGHTLNILLGGLGILVHGVRLNTLEFSKHKEMQWSGSPYLPFARTGAKGGGGSDAGI